MSETYNMSLLKLKLYKQKQQKEEQQHQFYSVFCFFKLQTRYILAQKSLKFYQIFESRRKETDANHENVFSNDVKIRI